LTPTIRNVSPRRIGIVSPTRMFETASVTAGGRAQDQSRPPVEGDRSNEIAGGACIWLYIAARPVGAAGGSVV